MLHLGDITKIKGAEIPPVDVITGGSPCQDLSVAGKRAGLEGERSGLFMEQIRIIKEMREHDKSLGRRGIDLRPRYMVWENVDGARSSGTPKGEDFRIVLEEVARVAEPDAVIPGSEKWPPAGCILGDGWSIAWRIHDAQFWGVAQRRRRIALVADFGGLSAPEILFERTGLQWDPGESQPKRKATSQDSRDGAESASYTIKVRGGAEIDSHGKRAGKGALIQDDLSATLGVTQDQTLVSKTYGISSFDSNAMKSPNPESGIYEASTSRTLDLNGGNPACNQGGTAVLEGNGYRPSHKGDGYLESDVKYTLNATEQHGVAYGINGDQAGTLDAHYYLGCGARGGKERDVVCQGVPVVDMGAGKSGSNVTTDLSPTLACTHGGEPAVATQPSYGLDRASYNQGENAKYDFTIAEETSPTIVARGGGAVAANCQQRNSEDRPVR